MLKHSDTKNHHDKNQKITTINTSFHLIDNIIHLHTELYCEKDVSEVIMFWFLVKREI